MRLSNKSAFSLACLILLLAIGLLVATTSVMAHPVEVVPATDPVTYISGHLATSPVDAHPVVDKIEALGDAADGYVNTRGFNIQVTFKSANAEPTNFAAADLSTTNSWTIRDVVGSGFVYTALVLPPAGSTSDVDNEVIQIATGATVTIKGGNAEVAIYSQPNADGPDADTDPDTGPAADKANPTKAVVTLDVTSPEIQDGISNTDPPNPDPNETAPVTKPMAGDAAPLPSTGWSKPFRVVFTITADASNDPSTIKLTADPDVLNFSSAGGSRDGTANEYEVDVTYKNKDVAANTSVTITIEVSDKAGNKGTETTMVTLAKRTATTDPDPDPADPTDPTKPSNIFKFTVPANSYVILVRNRAEAISNAPPIGQDFDEIVDIDGNRVIPDSKIIQWAAMPNLAELFDRGAMGGGGALVLRKAVGDSAAPAVGTVGISEIMWAIDAGYIGQSKARDSQWIEIHNLNTTAKDVLIYAQTGAQFTNTSKVIVDTQAGDRIYGKLGDANETKMVVDVMTNYFSGSDRGTDGWDIPGSNGSSKTGIDFVSMARKGTFDFDSKHKDGQYNKRYAKAVGSTESSDGRASGSWEAATVRYERLATDKPDSGTTDVPTTYDFIGTPGRPNTHTAATHITKKGRRDVPASPFVFNEVANRTNSSLEWIEIRNVTDANKNLRNYLISIVTSNSSDAVLYQFPNSDLNVPGKGVLLLVASDPSGNPDHPLAVGWNVDKNAEDQVRGLAGIGINASSKHGRYKVVSFGSNGLPDDGKFVLILREPDHGDRKHGSRSGGDGGKGVAETGNADLNLINDIAGWDDNLSKNQYPNAVSSTSLWPLYAMGGPFSHNRP